MTTAYTSLLGLALPVTGELSGTWGDTVNNSITSLLDSAIAGTQTLTADTTLTTTTGAANQSRQAILLCSPASANITITAPAQSKIYTVINTSATYTVTVRGVGPTTGVTLGVSEKAVVAWNGSDFIKISNTAGAGSFTTLSATGVATFSAGSAAAPAITTTGDTNTGIFFPAADTIAFSEGGAEAMRINSSGNLGIGTSSPAQKLDVAGTVRIVETGTPSGDAALQISVNGTNARTIRMTDTGSSGKTFDFINRAQGVAGNFGFFDDTASAYRYIIDSSGNLGLGVTPSAWASPYKALDIGNTGSFYFDSSGAVVSNNSFINSAFAYKYKTSNSATRYEQTSAGQHQWFNAASGTAGNTITFTQAMTLDASGRLGIGATSPAGRLDLGVITASASNQTVITSTNSINASFEVFLRDDVTTIQAGGTGNLAFSNGGSGGTERMRMDSSGNLLVGTTTLSNRLSVVAPSGQYVARFGLNGTGSQSFINFVIGENTTPTGVGSVTYNGSLTLYNQTSDQRLKENIVDAGTALATLGQIKIRSFDWIESKTHETHGVVAQELNEVAPQCVTEGINHEDGSIDRPWQVDTSPLVPMLIKAIQEQQALITTLTARITALEGA